MKLLLLSNSTNHGDGYLAHATQPVRQHLAEIRELIFVPYALRNWDEYTGTVSAALEPFGITVRGAHTLATLAELAAAPAVFVGGGNTFRLVDRLQRSGELGVLRESVLAGRMTYMGASAGTNIAAPTLRTTNDMPIVEPESFDTLRFLPFQINPHYVDPVPGSTHNGETRARRITEFLEENDVPVLGLREGTYLTVTQVGSQPGEAVVGGTAVTPEAAPAILFERDHAPRALSGDVSWLLATKPHFDVTLRD